jgi:hypothetical protein
MKRSFVEKMDGRLVLMLDVCSSFTHPSGYSIPPVDGQVGYREVPAEHLKNK